MAELEQAARIFDSRDAERAPTLASRRAERLRLFPVILTGGYAWFVGHGVLARASGWLSFAGLSALCAAAALVASPFAPTKRGSLYLALHVFLLATILTFFASDDAALATVQPGFAALSWLSYTIALGALSTPEPANRIAPEGVQFAPRSRASVVAPVLQLLVCVVVFGLFILSLDIQRVELRILSHVVTLGLGLLMLGISVRLGHWFQQREAGVVVGSLRRTVWVFLFLIGWCVLGWMSVWGHS